MSALPAVPRAEVLRAVDLYQTVEYARLQVRRAGPALPALLLATAGLVLGVSLLRRVLPPRLQPWIGVGLGALQFLGAMQAPATSQRQREFTS
jgi:hypothetical protein